MTPHASSMIPVELDSDSAVAAYFRASTAVCPFIEPAAGIGNLFSCEVVPDCQSARDIHPRLFEQLVPRIEQFRDARRALVDKRLRLLICHTVVIRVPDSLDAETARLLAWPNWLGWALKQMYTPKEVVFGFVRKGVIERSMFGQSVPVAPFHAVIIRSRVANSDHHFFPGNPGLLRAMMEADDDGQDVHAALFGDATPDVRSPQAMREVDYFERVQKWGQTILPKG